MTVIPFKKKEHRNPETIADARIDTPEAENVSEEQTHLVDVAITGIDENDPEMVKEVERMLHDVVPVLMTLQLFLRDLRGWVVIPDNIRLRRELLKERTSVELLRMLMNSNEMDWRRNPANYQALLYELMELFRLEKKPPDT